MHPEIKEIKAIFEHVSIDTFVKYFYVFRKHNSERSNNSIYIEFKNNKEAWSPSSTATRASKGKSIFRKSLDIPALIYITEYANSNKVSVESINKAKEIFLDITKHDELLNINEEIIDVSVKNYKVLVNVRSLQSSFRKRLINYWEGSSVLDCKEVDILIASHIKRFCDSNKLEKYDLFNGFLFTPNYDKLFDNHLITFDEKGGIIISKSLNETTLKQLGIYKSARIKADKLKPEHLEYLVFHREKFNSKKK